MAVVALVVSQTPKGSLLAALELLVSSSSAMCRYEADVIHRNALENWPIG